MTEREALKLALEALVNTEALLFSMGLSRLNVYSDIEKAITAIKEALAQPEQERKLICKMFGTLPIYDTPSQPEQRSVSEHLEPVAWRFTGIAGLKRYMTQKQYDAQTPETKKWYEPYKCVNCTAPPQRKEPEQELCPSCRNSDIYACTCTFKPAQPAVALEQKPVAKVCHDFDGHIGWNPKLTQLPDEGTPLYTTPPQRTWVGLTDEDVENLCLSVGSEPIEVRLIEAKLRSKNNG